MDKTKVIRLKVFRALCEHDCDWMSCWIPLPSTVIARTYGMSLYQCRKAMKQLVAEGLAVSDCCVIDPEESPLPYHGYRITAAGRETAIYKYIALRAARSSAMHYQGNVEHFLPENFDRRWLSRQEREQAAREYQEMMKLTKEISLASARSATWE